MIAWMIVAGLVLAGAAGFYRMGRGGRSFPVAALAGLTVLYVLMPPATGAHLSLARRVAEAAMVAVPLTVAAMAGLWVRRGHPLPRFRRRPS